MTHVMLRRPIKILEFGSIDRFVRRRKTKHWRFFFSDMAHVSQQKFKFLARLTRGGRSIERTD